MNQVNREPALSLGILVLDGCMLSSVGSPIDALRVAQKLAEIRDPLNAPRLEGKAISARGATSVRTSTGLELSGITPMHSDPHVLLVPGIMHSSPHDLLQRIEQMQPEMTLLRTLQQRGVRLAASCSGTFLLAASGVLDGRRATTSWWLAAAFRRHFPRVKLEPEHMLVDEGSVLTTGAATAVMNLILRLIGEAGGESLAQQTSRMLAIDPERQSQAPYVSEAMLERPRSSTSERAEHFLNTELHRAITVTRLAEHCRTSERSLLRHFRSHYGMSPLEHIQHLRVERAKALLETTHMSFDEIVERCGYSDVSSFRKLFKRATTLTPVDYRERFRLRAR
jgi:transcriptional regulator GlxA family with amidase domain